MPATATRNELTVSRDAYRRWMRPGGPEPFAIAMDRLLEFAGTFGIPDDKAKSALGFYRDALGLLPADLMLLAVQRITTSWKRFQRLPLPAEITDMVTEELGRRRLELARIEYALRELPRNQEGPPVDTEQRERNLALLRQADPLRRVPT